MHKIQNSMPVLLRIYGHLCDNTDAQEMTEYADKDVNEKT